MNAWMRSRPVVPRAPKAFAAADLVEHRRHRLVQVGGREGELALRRVVPDGMLMSFAYAPV